MIENCRDSVATLDGFTTHHPGNPFMVILGGGFLMSSNRLFAKDSTGKTFGRWTIIRVLRCENHMTIVLCQCVCGTVAEVRWSNLRSGSSTSCGCSKREDLTGKTFGYWTVLGPSELKSSGRVHFYCRCVCGVERDVMADNLRSGISTSCSCKKIEKLVNLRRKHGLSSTKEYVMWHDMIRRCYDTSFKSYHNYGGRGIEVCERWKNSFESFYEDMGLRPEGFEIDRIDNNGDYCPENCHYVSRKQNLRNKRVNRILSHSGESKTLTEWSEITGIAPVTLHCRIREGWSVSEALTLPIGTRIKSVRR